MFQRLIDEVLRGFYFYFSYVDDILMASRIEKGHIKHLQIINSPRQFRYLDFISQFTIDIKYVPCNQNIVTDALSRVEALSTTFDYAALAILQ